MDGPENITDKNRGKGVYKRVINAISLCNEFGISVKVMATLGKDFYEYNDFFMELCEKYKIENLKIGVIVPYGRAKKSKNLLEQRELTRFKKMIAEMRKETNFRQKVTTNIISVRELELYKEKILNVLIETAWIDWDNNVSLFPSNGDPLMNKSLKICKSYEFTIDKRRKVNKEYSKIVDEIINENKNKSTIIGLLEEVEWRIIEKIRKHARN